MKISLFVKQIKLHAKDEEQYLHERIKKTYVPYEQKVAHCENLIKASSVAPDGSYRRNTPAQFMMFIMRLIAEYTDLEVDKDDLLGEYDRLDENNLTGKLVAMIPEHEYVTWNTLIKMAEDDYYENERSLTAFLDHKAKAIGTLMDAIETVDDGDDRK